jgi:hypothetical protein
MASSERPRKKARKVVDSEDEDDVLPAQSEQQVCALPCFGTLWLSMQTHLQNTPLCLRIQARAPPFFTSILGEVRFMFCTSGYALTHTTCTVQASTVTTNDEQDLVFDGDSSDDDNTVVSSDDEEEEEEVSARRRLRVESHHTLMWYMFSTNNRDDLSTEQLETYALNWKWFKVQKDIQKDKDAIDSRMTRINVNQKLKLKLLQEFENQSKVLFFLSISIFISPFPPPFLSSG